MNNLDWFQRFPQLQSRLSHYYGLLHNQHSAFYRICKKIPISFDYDARDEELWEIHKQCTEKHDLLFAEAKIIDPSEILTEHKNLLDLKIELGRRLLLDCFMCENLCHVNRMNDERGCCGLGRDSYLASVSLHWGEEKVLIPSGTMFFAGCTFDCIFCQNSDISTIGKKKNPHVFYKPISARQIAEVAQNLKKLGAININYVGGDPTPNLATILASLQYEEDNICHLWNSNFYNSERAVELLIGVMDLWLPDFKYGNNECGLKYSGISRYVDVLQRNLQYIYNHGSKSIIIRHLVMPNHLECCTLPILEWIAAHIPNVVVNIMGQYRPEYLVNNDAYPEINRLVTKEEMERAFTWAENLGIEYQSASF